MKTELIETSDFNEVLYGDRIEVMRDNCVYLGVSVGGSESKPSVKDESFGIRGTGRVTLLKNVPEDWELRSIVREVPESPKKTPVIELDKRPFFSRLFNRGPSDREIVESHVFNKARKSGSKESLEEALESVEEVVDYFQNRVNLGDPLFDQWMVDAFDSAKLAHSEIKKLINALHGSEENENENSDNENLIEE
jgi:hypothetical protein